MERRSSAAYRIASIYSAAFALSIGVLGIAVYFAADADFRRQQDAAILEESTELIRDYRNEGMGELRLDLARRSGSANDFLYAVYDASGRRIAGTLTLPRPASGWSDTTIRDGNDDADPARVLTTALPHGQALVVAVDTDALERIDRTILTLFGVAFIAVALIGVSGALALGRYLRLRLDRIGGTARAIAAGELDQRVAVGRRNDEFDQLGAAFNAMLERIAGLMENLRQISSDVAHDLRTPLARLRAELEVALDSPADIATQRIALKRALAQSDALLSLFAAILRISEVEAGGMRASFAPLDLSALVADLCETYAPAIADSGRTLRCEIASGIVIDGDRELVAQALVNLLDNAQAYTPRGSAIVIDVESGNDGVMLTVADNGPGVAAADRARIVRRFVRLEHSRTSPGHGLGLNLVEAIARTHGGSLMIDDNEPGLRAVITLPRSG